MKENSFHIYARNETVLKRLQLDRVWIIYEKKKKTCMAIV